MNGRFCNRFWMDALDLEIAGVHYEEDSGIAAPPVFEIRGADTFKAVRDALADKYEIIVKENNSLYEPDPSMSPEEAKRFIEQARGG